MPARPEQGGKRMEETVEMNEYKTEEKPSMMQAASESLLANLPLLILGMVIFLTMAREIIG